MTINELNVENRSLEQEVDRKNRAVEASKRDFESLLSARQESLREIEPFRERNAHQDNRLSAADMKVRMQTQILTKMELEWQVCKEKVALLSDENKTILQEKAVIHGQLLQLQS